MPYEFNKEKFKGEILDHIRNFSRKTLEDAYYKMEKLERYSKIILLAKLLGKPRKLSGKNINDILKISERTYGIKPDKRNI